MKYGSEGLEGGSLVSVELPFVFGFGSSVEDFNGRLMLELPTRIKTKSANQEKRVKTNFMPSLKQE